MHDDHPPPTDKGDQPTIITFDNSGDGPLRVPGFGTIPLTYELPSDARFAHGIQEWRQAPAVTARELAVDNRHEPSDRPPGLACRCLR
ncbi:uncharacterized protein BP01DRAFT_357185 [Aspergillus saccharolyticus JOP 1030-1]|uniref:Uncharacterized protein n=1 Tax=Aspergillus saccharolyticus JOP 1030-1 TaxID=1450539 RepID=A0A318ZLY7_9EURO|nr:hypothetical protein BP01DRAFT_357185 [Aspergillus saccharolyticus JOP 1030-1]PYH44840.1 hypothetical protein BP01DRAFT_357185 [Aspergillus saccharolyticus JOP 1030-1]